MEAPDDVLERPVFSVSGTQFLWGDVVHTAEHLGDLVELERRAAEGVAALERLDRARSPLGAGETRAAAEQFRYARRLLAGEELEAWLGRWGLTTADWLAYVRRSLARERVRDGIAETLVEYLPSAGEVDELLWPEAVCSGWLAEAAWKLAGRAAAADALGRDLGIGADALEAAFQELAAREPTAEAKSKLLEARRVDWLQVDCSVLELEDEEAAREAALCVREDGMALADVAALAGTSVAERTLVLAEVGPALAEALLSAVPGDLVGPVPVEAGFLIVAVRDKRAPAPNDPAVDGRLADGVVARAAEREIGKRVRWHEHP